MVTASAQQNEEKYAELSRRLLQQAQDEFDKGDRLQASWKAWDAAAHAMKAAAERRGWNHSRIEYLFAVADQVAGDTDNPELRTLFSRASTLYQNFHEDWQPDDMVQEGIHEVRLLVELMEELHNQPVQPSVVANEATSLDPAGNDEQMRRMVDFFNTGDLSTLASVVAPDYIDHQGVGQGPLLGADGFAGVVQLSRERHPKLSVDVDELHVVGDVVVTKLIWSEPESGQVDFHTYRQTMEVVRFAEGLAVEHWGVRLG